MSDPSDNEQPRAAVTPGDGLPWQSELDSAMTDLDSRLSHPRRRARDIGTPQPALPELGTINLTSELLDEIAWRVAEQMRRSPAALSRPPIEPPLPLPPPPGPPPAIPSGISIVIRVRRPLFSWRFWRRRSRRRQAMITFSDYRVT